MPGDNLIRGLLLPDLELTSAFFRKDPGTNLLEAKKTSAMEVCPRCATPSKTIYDRRLVRVRDAPIQHHLLDVGQVTGHSRACGHFPAVARTLRRLYEGGFSPCRVFSSNCIHSVRSATF